MYTPMSLSTSIIQASDPQTLALIQELGDEKLIAAVTSQLKALSVEGENPILRQQRLQLVERVVNAAIVIRKHRTLQQQMALVTYDAKQITREVQAQLRQDREILERELEVHTETVEGSLESIVKTHKATQDIVQSCIEDTKQTLSKTNATLSKTEKELREKQQQEQALIAQSQSLALSLGY